MKNNLYSVKIVVEAGKGGDGHVSFQSAPYKPRGGPDGGDGGKGGDVIIKTDNEYHSLEHLQYELIVKAPDGAPGSKNKKHGKNGQDRIILVPPGTIVYNQDKKEVIADMVLEGKEIKLAHGGRGGQGNSHFATSTNQAPRVATPGEKGENKSIQFEFSPIIDVAVIGPPNTGKSSLIAKITGGSPDIGNYPFTTIKPHLWSYLHNYDRLTFLDTPPLVSEYLEDIKILIRRARLLIVVFEGSIDDIREQYKSLEEKIIPAFVKNEKKSIVFAVNKVDKKEEIVNISIPYPVFPISVKHNKGLKELKSYIFGELGEK